MTYLVQHSDRSFFDSSFFNPLLKPWLTTSQICIAFCTHILRGLDRDYLSSFVTSRTEHSQSYSRTSNLWYINCFQEVLRLRASRKYTRLSHAWSQKPHGQFWKWCWVFPIRAFGILKRTGTKNLNTWKWATTFIHFSNFHFIVQPNSPSQHPINLPDTAIKPFKIHNKPPQIQFVHNGGQWTSTKLGWWH
jgi:hypothetical protein